MAANEITAELAQKALRVEAANVLKKLQGGKTLTAAERALIQSIAEGGNPADAKAWAKSKVELAQALGTTRQTIDRWVKLKRNGPPKPEANGRWKIADWKRWMKETGRGGGLAGDALEDELPRLNAKRLLLINERLELDNAERRGDLISRDDVVREAAEIATKLRGDLYGLGNQICAEVMKMTELDEALPVYNSAVDRALEVISHGLKSARRRRRKDVDEELEDATFEEVGNNGTGR